MNKPIGCNAFHFYKKEGKKWICMYCKTEKKDGKTKTSNIKVSN